MKKLFLCAAVVLAAVAGTFCYNSESRNVNEMSDLAKANVKALAEEEDGNTQKQCFWIDYWNCSETHWGTYCNCFLEY